MGNILQELPSFDLCVVMARWLPCHLTTSATSFKDMPVPSVSNVCAGIHRQVDMSLLPAEFLLCWEKRVKQLHSSCPAWLLMVLLSARRLGVRLLLQHREVLSLSLCHQSQVD